MANFYPEDIGEFGVPGHAIEQTLNNKYDPYSGIDMQPTSQNFCSHMEFMRLPEIGGTLNDGKFRRIYDYNPDMKLIAILRNPIDRAFSNWNMEKQRKRETRTFLDSIKYEIENIDNIKQSRTFSYLQRGFYSKQINRILKLFKKDQLLCIKNENLRNEPNLVLNKISNFLNITKFKNIEKINIHSRFYHNILTKNERETLKSFLCIKFHPGQ